MNANESYHEKRMMIEIEIEVLKQKLESMDIEQKKDVNNWGYAGNCGHILEEIENLNEFMGRY